MNRVDRAISLYKKYKSNPKDQMVHTELNVATCKLNDLEWNNFLRRRDL